MDFDNLLMQVVDLLRREGRVSYRALKVRFRAVLPLSARLEQRSLDLYLQAIRD